MALKAGSQYKSILTGPTGAWTPMGTTGQYVDMMGVVEPQDNTALLNKTQSDNIYQDMDLKKKKFDLFSQFLKTGMGGMGSGSGSLNFQMPSLPGPNYINAGPVWSQQQINAQSNLQRGNLLTQASNQSRQFSNDLASRGFSPLSPMSMFNEQNNMMRANAGAAANETATNWTAAKGNSDATLAGQGINANLYGDYIKSLSNQNSTRADLQYKQQALQQDLFATLLKGLM